MLCETHQLTLEVREVLASILIAEFQLFTHLVIKVLQQLSASQGHSFADLGTQFTLKNIERRLNVRGLPALLVNLGNALLEVNARLDDAQHLVTGSEYTLEQL